MPKYLAVAEKVYKNIKKDDLFTNDLTQNLNCLISQIRKAIKGTEFMQIKRGFLFNSFLFSITIGYRD